MSLLPNFLIIGAPKAGSTTLWNELRQHPEIFLTAQKEPNFFCADSPNYLNWSWYHSLFVDSVGKKAIGEASVAYSLVERNPTTPELIAKNLPHARLIYIVRHPLRRIESAWLHHICMQNPVPKDFSEAVREFRPLIEGTLYTRNLAQYRQYFPDERILVVFLEDLKNKPRQVLQQCDRFLEVDPEARNYRPPTPVNVSAQRYIEGSLMEKLRKLPGWQTAEKQLPGRLRRSLRKWTRTPLPSKPKWDNRTQQWAIAQIGDDAKAILEYAGKPLDFWQLDLQQ